MASNPAVYVDDSDSFIAQAIEVSAAEGFDVANLNWSSSNPDVADFDNGLLVVLSEGVTTITASFDGNDHWKEASATCTLRVDRRDTNLYFDTGEVSLFNNATEADIAAATPSLKADGPFNLAKAQITWTSSNENLVIVLEDGEIMIDETMTGEAVITARFSGNNVWKPAEASYKVVVMEPIVSNKKKPGLYFAEGPIRIDLNEAGKETSTLGLVAAEGFDLSKLTWSSTVPDIFEIENNVIITKKTGSAAVVVRFTGDDEWEKDETNCRIIVFDSQAQSAHAESETIFNFTTGNCVNNGANASDSEITLTSGGSGLFTATIRTAQNCDGKLSYVENEGWKFNSASGESDYVITISPNEVKLNPEDSKGTKYKIIGVYFGSSVGDDEIVTVKEENENENEEKDIDQYLWTAPDETAKESPIFTVQTLGTSFTLNSIEITFEHDEIEKPEILRRMVNGQPKVYLTHPYEDHKIMYRIVNAATQAVISRSEANSKTAGFEGEEYVPGTELQLTEGQELQSYAVHPHGMKSNANVMNYKMFNDIITSVDDINVSEENGVRYFNLQGTEISKPTEGVFIRVENGKASKVRF